VIFQSGISVQQGCLDDIGLMFRQGLYHTVVKKPHPSWCNRSWEFL